MIAATRLIAPVVTFRPARAATAMAALLLSACTTLGIGEEAMHDAPAGAEIRAAQLQSEVEKLRTEKAQLERKLAEAQRAAAAPSPAGGQAAASPAPDLVDPEPAPLVAPALKADAVVAAADANRALKDAPARPVEPSPRLVQPSFASGEDAVFENEAAGMIKTSSVLFGVHLASYRGEEEARAGWRKLQRENPDELGLLEPRIEAVDLEGRGHFLRLIGGGFSTAETAAALCGKLQAKGVYCSVTGFKGDPLSFAQLR